MRSCGLVLLFDVENLFHESQWDQEMKRVGKEQHVR